MSQVAPSAPKAPESLAERFWSIARQLEPLAPDESGMPDPAAVVRHVLRVLDALAAGQQGDGITVHTLSFIALLRQYELRGDLAYASPEQARGEQLDERSIVFSVGVLLFEKLTGRHPFGDKTNPRRLARIQRGEIASGVNYFPAVPAGLRAVLIKAMGPFPEERYEGLAMLRAELERFVAEASRPGPKGTTPPALRRVPPPAPRPSQAMAAPADSDGPTRLMTGPAPQASPANVPAARPSVTPVALPDEAQARSIFDLPPGQKEAGTLPAHRSAPAPASWKRFAPLAYLGAGAAVASAFFALSTGEDGKTVSVAPAQAAPALSPPEPEPVPVPAPGPVPGLVPAPVPGLVPAPVPGLVPAPVPGPGPVPVAAPPPAPPPPAVFDPQSAGDKALALAAACFTADQLATGAHFGVSIVFARPDGLARRLYFAGEEITPAERQCLTQAYVGQLSAGPLDKATVVEYRLHVKQSGSELKLRVVEDK